VVDGFIPLNAFMEFQAYNVLVIALDIRQLEHIEYTPARILFMKVPVMPIIASPDYTWNTCVVFWRKWAENDFI
jgi:phenylalanine-4-hydroxylase